MDEIWILYRVSQYMDGCGWVAVSDLFMDGETAIETVRNEVIDFMGEEEYQNLLKKRETNKVNGVQYAVFASYAHIKR